MQIKKCLYCGKEFEDTYNRGRKYCCKNHQKMYWRKFINPELHQKTTKAYHDKIMSDEIRHNKLKKQQLLHNSSLKGRYTKIKAQAKIRNYTFNLTREEYEKYFFNEKCYYCHGDTVGGIDRLDNNKGYELENCVPCCPRCNTMKLSMQEQEFYAHCKQIITVYEDRLNNR